VEARVEGFGPWCRLELEGTPLAPKKKIMSLELKGMTRGSNIMAKVVVVGSSDNDATP
jgi:hypothetical protein